MCAVHVLVLQSVIPGVEALELVYAGSSFDADGFSGRTLDGEPRFVLVRKPEDAGVCVCCHGCASSHS